MIKCNQAAWGLAACHHVYIKHKGLWGNSFIIGCPNWGGWSIPAASQPNQPLQNTENQPPSVRLKSTSMSRSHPLCICSPRLLVNWVSTSTAPSSFFLWPESLSPHSSSLSLSGSWVHTQDYSTQSCRGSSIKGTSQLTPLCAALGVREWKQSRTCIPSCTGS